MVRSEDGFPFLFFRGKTGFTEGLDQSFIMRGMERGRCGFELQDPLFLRKPYRKMQEVNQDNFICGGRFMEEGKRTGDIFLKWLPELRRDTLWPAFLMDGRRGMRETAAWIAARRAAGISAERDPLKELEDFCRDANGQIFTWTEKP